MAQRLPPPEKVDVGPKTGILGVYPCEEYEGEADTLVHHPECCAGFWEDLRDPYIQEALEAEEEDEEPYVEPDCIWCKSSTHVWSRFTEEQTLHWCLKCQKVWDQDEDEAVA
jgi:hypothetical protein